MRKALLLPVVLLLAMLSRAQQWAPTSILSGGRYDDIFFLNDSVGWAAGGREFKIFHTTNSGFTWQEQLSPKKYLRSIEFLTNKIGFCGSLDTSLYKTTDGGLTWIDIANSISPRPVGFCGLASPDSMTIYGCGIWRSPAYIVRSTDQGQTWAHFDMSAYASALVDVLFLSRDTGFAIGKAKEVNDGGIILYTTNGGSGWSILHKTRVPGDIVWKIQSPDKKNYFASIEALPSAGNTRMLKSTDKGQHWNTLIIQPVYKHLQMIGFTDPLTGWAGDDALYETNDGGQSWQTIVPNGNGYNRFFRVNDSVSYLSGHSVYKRKYMAQPPPVPPTPIEKHSLQVMPNPTKGSMKIELAFNMHTFASLAIYTNNGRRVVQLIHARVAAGRRTVSFDLRNHASGIYFVVLRTNEGLLYQQIIKN